MYPFRIDFLPLAEPVSKPQGFQFRADAFETGVERARDLGIPFGNPERPGDLLGLRNGLRQIFQPKCPIPSGSLIPDTVQICLLKVGGICTRPYR